MLLLMQDTVMEDMDMVVAMEVVMEVVMEEAMVEMESLKLYL